MRPSFYINWINPCIFETLVRKYSWNYKNFHIASESSINAWQNISKILINVLIVLIDKSHIINISKGIPNTLYISVCIATYSHYYISFVINTLPTICRKYFQKMGLPTSRYSLIQNFKNFKSIIVL